MRSTRQPDSRWTNQLSSPRQLHQQRTTRLRGHRPNNQHNSDSHHTPAQLAISLRWRLHRRLHRPNSGFQQQLPHHMVRHEQRADSRLVVRLPVRTHHSTPARHRHRNRNILTEEHHQENSPFFPIPNHYGISYAARQEADLDEEWYEPLRPFHILSIVRAEFRQQDPLFHQHTITIRHPENSKQHQQRPRRLHRQSQSDERDQDPGIRWVSDQAISTLHHHPAILSHPHSPREESSHDRDRPLPTQNT